MKIHYSDEEYGEEGICKIYSENLESDWELVTCKKCLNKRKQCEEWQIRNEAEILKQMGEMADYFESSKGGINETIRKI